MIDRIGFIGYGNMGEAIGNSIHEKLPDIKIIVAEQSLDRQSWIKGHCPWIELVDIQSLVKSTDMIFLAIKPQQLSVLAKQISPLLQTNQMLISMLAGVSAKDCCQVFDHQTMIRIMPNTPAKLAKGVTGAYIPSHISNENKKRCLDVLSLFGTVIQLKEESLMNVITAMSGSGPAFFYRMAKVFIDFGVSNGLDKQDAENAAIGTMLGAGHVLSKFGDPDIQIDQVSSPNGTTVAGLKSMDNYEFDDMMTNVLDQALNRAKALSKEVNDERL